MRIDEVVLDRERLFKMKQQYDLRKKKERLINLIQQAQDQQEKLVGWMNSNLDKIEHMPDKMFQLELQPVIRNFMGGVSPIEVLLWALTDKGSDTFTKDQYELARKVALKRRTDIVEMLHKQLQKLDELAQEADQKEWSDNWKKLVTRYDALRTVIQKQLKFFTKVKF